MPELNPAASVRWIFLLGIAAGTARGSEPPGRRRFPKTGPRRHERGGPLGLLGRYVEGAAAPPLGPSDIEVGTVAASGIAMTSTVGVATAAGGFRGGTRSGEHTPEIPAPTYLLLPL